MSARSIQQMIPYGRQSIDDDDVKAVVAMLQSEWLTTGPAVDGFEDAFAAQAGAEYAVAVSSGTAALHAAMFAIDLGPGDEVIVPSMTFAATANAAVFMGAVPVFADVDPTALLLRPAAAEEKITSRTKAIVAVDYTGQACDYDALREVADKHQVLLIADACHAVGGAYKGRPVGSLADLSTFSFHPVKHITTGEGGMVATDNAEFAGRMRRFRNHGITTDRRQRAERGSWFYEMVDLGFNYRITDIQCALGLSQLKKLPGWIARRQEVAGRYDAAFGSLAAVQPLERRPDVSHAYHLYVVQLDLDRLGADRSQIFSALRDKGIGVNVHYIPVNLHPFYRQRFGTGSGLCPVAEAAYERILSLPMFSGMSDDDATRVIEAVFEVTEATGQ